MTTRVIFLGGVSWVGTDTTGITDRAVKYSFEAGDIVDVSDDALAASIIADGAAAATTDPVTITEADVGVFIPVDELITTPSGISSVTDNGNGTFTHSDGNGTSVTISTSGASGPSTDINNSIIAGSDLLPFFTESVTSLSFSGVTSSLTYTDEAGTANVLSLASLATDTYIASATWNNASDTLTLTDNAAAQISLSLSGIRATLTNNANGTYTFSDGQSATTAIDVQASALPTSTGSFTGVLSATDTTVQIALETLSSSVPTIATSSPLAATGATSVVGTTSRFSPDDHRHPAQGVSADANNSLTVGTDGLHYFAQTTTALSFNTLTKQLEYINETGTQVNIDITGAATLSSATPATATNAVGIVGTSTAAARGDHRHAADPVSTTAGNKIVVGTDGLHAFVGSDRVHATNTAVAPAIAGSPTTAEILAAVADRDVIVYYTGDDVVTSSPTRIYHIDASGNVTDISSKVSANTTSSYVEIDGMYIVSGTVTVDGLSKAFPVTFAAAPNVVVSGTDSAKLISVSASSTTDFTPVSVIASTGITSNAGEAATYYAMGAKA